MPGTFSCANRLGASAPDASPVINSQLSMRGSLRPCVAQLQRRRSKRDRRDCRQDNSIVEPAPSQVYSAGSAPPSALAGLVSVKGPPDWDGAVCVGAAGLLPLPPQAATVAASIGGARRTRRLMPRIYRTILAGFLSPAPGHRDAVQGMRLSSIIPAVSDGARHMSDNRRRYRRFTGPYDGSWDGLTGAHDCRVTDLGAGGCFVDSIGRQDMGGEVTVTVVVAGQSFTLPGKVVYLDRVQGFGVQFTESDATRQLAAVLEEMP